MNSVSQELNKYKERVNTRLSSILSILPSSNLRRAMEYALFNGGKRLRPMIVYATGVSLGASIEALDISAASIECMHSFSLIHDDLPAIDNDDLRRGKPSCHKEFGEAIAILAGDALQTLSFEILSEQTDFLSPEQQIEMTGILAKAAGASGMGYGQSLDITNQQNISLETLSLLHQAKTGRILEACVQFGIITAQYHDQNKISTLLEFAKQIGLAFQIHDDILDIEGETKTLGKSTGSDHKLNKITYPRLLGLKQTKKILDELLEQAMLSLKIISLENSLLAEIAHFIVDRDH